VKKNTHLSCRRTNADNGSAPLFRKGEQEKITEAFYPSGISPSPRGIPTDIRCLTAQLKDCAGASIPQQTKIVVAFNYYNTEFNAMRLSGQVAKAFGFRLSAFGFWLLAFGFWLLAFYLNALPLKV
jgi:hypothetical protein